MSISRFEAAAAYDRSLPGAPGAGGYLVLDLDGCSLGVCDSSGMLLPGSLEGRPGLDLWENCIQAISSALGPSYPFDIRQDLLQQLPAANKKLRNYFLADRMLETAAFRFSSHELSCARVEQALSQVKETIFLLLEQAAARVSRASLNPEQLRVILLGKAAGFYYTEYLVREAISADPLLPDLRFANSGYAIAPDQIVEAGMAAHQQMQTLRHTLELLVLDREREHTITLAEKGQSREALAQAPLFGPVFLLPGDPLRLRLDGDPLFLPMNPSCSKGSALYLSAGAQGEELFLNIRMGARSFRQPIEIP